MILGIDASNIKSGGGVTHLKELLGNAKPEKYGFDRVILWSVEETLCQIEDKSWLEKVNYSKFFKSRIYRWYWQKFKLPKLAQNSGCKLLFIPGGSFSGKFRPFITMSQNLLPFEWGELKRYGLSFHTLRLLLLYFFQGTSFRKSDGIIFLTKYAKDLISKKLNLKNSNIIIPHGINKKFFHNPRKQNILLGKKKRPIELLYVSFIGAYKHQWNVLEAVSDLNCAGIPIHLSLVGSHNEKASVNKLFQKINHLNSSEKIISLYPNVSYKKISEFYLNADLFIFASTCENLPNILIEAMASGLPILSSKYGPMPEVLDDAGLYCDPLSVEDIKTQLKKLIFSKELRENLSLKAYKKAKQYSWKRNADITFDFFYKIVKAYKKY
ncbi:glycosyltransferase [Leptospira interrogans]|uniref:Glycosyltransferase family 4 protein n=5 Tax=Leptospira interrogans TaxID=173 RepID=A0AAQ0AZN0_LEPIR|nr:unknown [Leptospira interrogans]AAS70713.1 glycosyl transferase [Leptospira interrogans serovar Copenhageni str. Fiocruz L1-130]ARB94886.1 glycosyltransferase family 1 protein [Leptospira interrogans serovar Copenhageni]EKP23861.1 glycosyltransferase, group 1 family protein [Leptospira interrogans serovar Icterohaemorrhagiae str. Verdun LP]EKP75590.1 glycosyltransferase, group 1 family protein [Leptospira interrogans str. HAI1594]EMJ54245.1 glycosyltransferase, group 1 family protein [Lepto